MNHVMLRPDLKTAGGEVCDILYKNRFVGTLALVYRESDRIAGTLQLEKEVLSETEKDEVSDHVHTYVWALVDALRARDCEVMVTYSSYDHVIATEDAPSPQNRSSDAEEEPEYGPDWVDYSTRLEDENPDEREEYTMADYEMVVVGEDDDSIEYHIYDNEDDLVAEVFLTIEDRIVTGTVDWLFEPSGEELNTIADLIILDFNEDEVDGFVIHMQHLDELIETIELMHEDLLPKDDADDDPDVYPSPFRNEYTIVLARDDGGVLTYEIYQQSRGGLPIGTATVDISQRQLTGFIDFREPGSTDDRELIATLLMEELDKEKDYDTINLTMMHKNRLIEEVLFETEHVH
ncbi:hypothetical protein PN4B1_09800 [Paenibacillus naphthalenovorans]|uniref:hypothetical protein n=1 Tax=Paenibacillus naphthalenovorans TaxID=162209 RepID=UPI0010B9E82E|nr:hypothetical protein [Paenibacillus naphthalenovorans]GCL71076.1 hypothetical protein PN4B1_09800 [Paenibacillus naphthalenovorans]